MGYEAIRLAELTGAIARASDGATGLPPETSLRTCVIAVELARAVGLTDDELRDVYYAALLRHAGCTASSHEETVLVGDDFSLRGTLALADPMNKRELLPLAVRGLARGRGPVARARAVVGFVAGAGGVSMTFRGRCEVAVRFAVRMSLGPRVERALGEAYERWDGRGVPDGVAGEALSITARVIALAEVAASHLAVGGAAGARDVIAARAGGHLDPELAARFAKDGEALLAMCRGPSAWQQVLDAEPSPRARVGATRLDAVLELLADFADLKSTWTLGHSRGVARLAVAAATSLGVTGDALASLRAAALLHDLGRVAVSNAIWDKPGPLDPGELEQARGHAYQTERVLSQVEALAPFARLASLAHERVDGSGYHRGLSGGGLDTAARVLAAADVVHALSEERPHRPALGVPAMVDTARAQVKRGLLDARAVDAVLAAVGARAPGARAAHPRGLSEREVEVLRLVARGLTDKEIAQKLDISHRTVQHHNQHAYAKIGASTRAAAALFLIEQDLLDPA